MGRCALSMEGGGPTHGSTVLGQCDSAEDVVFWRPFASAVDLHGHVDPHPHRSSVEEEAPRPPDTCCSPTTGLAPSPKSAFRPVKHLQCAYCGIPFLNSGELVGHLRVHTGDRPYKCEACERAFARNEELTRHRRIHSGDKPHACDLCARRFARKDHLGKHRKTHLDEAHKRVHVCSQPGCGHRYTRTDALTRHQWTAHAIRRCSRWQPPVI
ncbi:uncharacterized protein LOC119175736 [Rhipicephalus microplus]|uniref:uncharacterized protein LOC119175736 n=1 Tax=Rhipicephalus microplus TaxID=6941 RepID=UPI003F6B831B